MCKIILLSGSPNPNGNTVQVFTEMKKVFEEAGMEAEVVSLAGMNLQTFTDENNNGKDDFEEVIDKIKDAQGLIVGGPVYWGTVRAELMEALQKIAMASKKQGDFLSRMVGGAVAIGRRGGLTSSLQEMLMFYLANDMIIVGSTYWNIVFGSSSGEAIKDKEGMYTLENFSKNVAFLIRKIYH